MVSNTPKGTGRPEKSRHINLKPRKLDFTPVVNDVPDNLLMRILVRPRILTKLDMNFQHN